MMFIGDYYDLKVDVFDESLVVIFCLITILTGGT